MRFFPIFELGGVIFEEPATHHIGRCDLFADRLAFVTTRKRKIKVKGKNETEETAVNHVMSIDVV